MKANSKNGKKSAPPQGPPSCEARYRYFNTAVEALNLLWTRTEEGSETALDLLRRIADLLAELACKEIDHQPAPSTPAKRKEKAPDLTAPFMGLMELLDAPERITQADLAEYLNAKRTVDSACEELDHLGGLLLERLLIGRPVQGGLFSVHIENGSVMVAENYETCKVEKLSEEDIPF